MIETERSAKEKSEKSYGLAVALCGIFGTVGVHHFYIGNWVHGIIDLTLFLGFIILLILGIAELAIAVLLVDVLHTLFVFYKLIVGEQRDGQGRLITWRV
ncbi:MAG: TM2 domain-containing protein [Rhodospirillales bacterium]|jgi:TM2 domain-containing membrane protein YozV